jgi:rhodanese-related sulfurtransferase
MKVTQFLRSKGYTRVSNVKGGIDAWSLKVDPRVPRY